MKRALMRSANLIGDGLSISPALRAWHKLHPDYEIDLLTLPDFIAEIYGKMGVPLNVVTDEANLRHPYDFEHVFDVGKAFDVGQKGVHIIDAYAELLLGPDFKLDEKAPTFIPTEEDHPKGLILISPFSRSCSSHEGHPPNKMLPWPAWQHIVSLLRSYGALGVLGGRDDAGPLPVAENERYLGLPLNQVALMLRDAKLLVTIDNGIAHLAASQRTTMIEFYPACLGIHWVAPVGHPDRTFVIQVDPAKLGSQEGAAQALLATRRGIRTVLAGA